MQPQANNFSQQIAPEKPKHHFRATLITLAWLCLLAAIGANHQNITDWWRLRNYDAPATVAQLASDDGMTSYGRKVFYVNRPSIESKTSFAESCPSGGEQTIVLGCYRGGQSGIYLLDVTDERLNGVEQVTAAHEMLHAAYDRLSSSERSKVDAMLLDYYKNDLTDQRILATIAAYKKTEPNDVVNEMHSVFGSEVSNLPTGLETYYKKYFNNRQGIAAYATRYQAEFTSRQAIVAQDDAKLADLKAQIETKQSDLKSKLAEINSRQADLNSLRSSNNVDAYNAGVPAYNAMVAAYNAEVQQIHNLIAEFNDLVAARNAVALEENQLSKALQSDTTEISQ